MRVEPRDDPHQSRQDDDWLDITDDADWERFKAAKSEYGDEPLPYSAYKDRKRVVRSYPPNG